MSFVIPPITAAREGRTILSTPTISFKEGKLTAILGPNGAGKSSLLQHALGQDGEACATLVHGEELQNLSQVERARRVAYLPQKPSMAWPLTVIDAVALGRFAYGAGPGQLRTADQRAVEQALKDTELEEFSQRRTDTLSGGELARLHIARLLATEAPILIADEPAASLDPRHQHALMALLRAQAAQGKTVVTVLHDLALAHRYADDVVLLNQGSLTAHGATADVLTPSAIAETYGVAAEITPKGLQVTGPAHPPNP
ncbi:ABC transporter ATP-binding protein [Parvularcula sp. ZS-1/3]|uniref:ABC transporter ATP-binding protein n=1 Tax=Parvularcula mediterranea TaxID=2732508 RepID=A0A7Y3W3G4_9PROT|nr:ABC transporter ATP-binding protein [Parvularcula mediterranea]